MKKGIDLHKALQILGERAKDEEHHHHHHDHDTENARGCKQNAPEEAKHWGQTIDLAKVVEKEEEALSKQKEALEEERKTRRRDFQQQIDGMSFQQVLAHVFRTQEQRVATYRAYDRGLDEVLKTGNLSRYPGVCAEATASFSVLSESINYARIVMENKFKKSTTAALVCRLQQAEKEKLNYTAALHLEQMRSQAHLSTEGDQTIDQSSASISSMLLKDVRSLKQKIIVSVETVNEVLDELKFAMVETEE